MVKKVRKGLRLRPCTYCGTLIRFMFWEEESEARKKRIFHWVDEDGLHHVCQTPETSHLRSILNEE